MTEKELNQDAERQIKTLEEEIQRIREGGPYHAMLFVGVVGEESGSIHCSVHRDSTMSVSVADAAFLATRLRVEVRELEETIFCD